MTHTIRRSLAVILFASVGWTGTGVAGAQEQPPAEDETVEDEFPDDVGERPRWSVHPAGTDGLDQRTHFFFTLPPGQQILDTVAITNPDPEPLTVELYPADAFNTTPDGGFGLRLVDEPRIGVGDWVRLDIEEHTIPPETTAEIPFALVVPEDAEPGDHAGAILAASVEPDEADEGEVGVEVHRRVGARVYLRVEGPLDPALSIENLSVDDHQPVLPYLTGSGRTDVEFTVTNTGNVRLAPTAQVELVAPFGVVVGRSDAQALPELLPGGSVQREAEIDGLPPLGRLQARVVVSTDETETSASSTVWAVPWVYLLIVLLLLAYWQWRRRRRQRAEHAEVPPPEPEPAPRAETEEQLTP
jgi:hypothetical protein